MKKHYPIIINLNKLKIYLLALVFIFLPEFTRAQDFKNILQQMRNVYSTLSDLHVVMSVNAYEESQTETPFYTLKADIKRAGDNYLYHYGENYMLLNDKYLILVDGDTKEMVYRQREKSHKNEMPAFFDFSIDSILTFYEEPEYLGREADLDYYRISQKTGPVSYLDLVIDPQTSTLRQMGYRYIEGPYVKIDFELFDTQPVFDQSTFGEGRFVRLSNGKIITATSFSNFHLMESSD